jgi:plastocyanin
MRGMTRVRETGSSLALGALVAVGSVVAPAPAVAQGAVAGRIAIDEKPGEKTSDFANAVIYLEPKAGAAKTAPGRVVMPINGRNFSPRVRVVTPGSTVDFPNQDPFTHNVFSTTEGSKFDLGSYGSNAKGKSQEFRKAGPIPVYCNVHAKMTAYVVVVNTPFFTQASNDGRWEIGKVPAGKYTMTVWHERAAAPVTTEVDVPAAGLAALESKLDARGFKEVAHKDKNGKDYATRGVVY